jgi:4-hydroxy-2-oxoheptanedioate aldolase
MPEMRRNPAKAKLAAGGVVTAIGGVYTAQMADFIGTTGVEGVWLEAEHGPLDFADIEDITRACDLWGMASVVRVGRAEANTIYRTLDCGAQGIVVPHINTREEAELVVDSAKYAPLGSRGMFSTRQGYGVGDYLEHANNETFVCVLIEDIVAVENLDEIVSVDNIDVFLVAPSDLAQSMGHLGDVEHPEVQAVIDRSIQRIVDAGRIPGHVGRTASVASYIQKGVRFFNANLNEWLTNGAAIYTDEVKKGLAG